MLRPAPARLALPALSSWSLLSSFILVLCLPATAFAADVLDTGDTAWILTSTALVLFMTIPGLALFYAGLVRTKNVLSVLMHCLALTALMTILWLAVGYSLAFDTTGMVEGQTGLRAFIGGARQGLPRRRRWRNALRNNSGSPLLHLPVHICRDHPGPDDRCLRRTHALFGGPDLLVTLADRGLRTDLSYDLGWRRWLFRRYGRL